MREVDAIYPFLRHTETTTFGGLPQHVVELTKRFILDTLGTMIAGIRAPGCREVLEQLSDWGGKPEATVLGTGQNLPSPYAALANSMMAHALDFDDIHELADVHANAVVLPSVLSASEVAGNVSGRELIAAVAVGVDVACRMGIALKKHRGWHPTATCGIFGATLAAGRVSGLKGSHLHNAVGIAYSLASGNWQCILDAALTKRLQPAFAASGAMQAVALARRGITGARDILEGKAGFYPLYELGEYNPALLTDGLGERFEVEALSMKPYASIRYCHSAVDAVLELCSEAEIIPEEIDSIQVEMPQEGYDYSGGPFNPADSPQVSAQFNTAYNVAVALVYRRIGLEHFDRDAILDPKVMAVAERVKVFPNDDTSAFGPVTVTITLRSGVKHIRRITTMKGHPEKPMTEAERTEKLRNCVAYAGWPERRATELSEWVSKLDRSVAPLADLKKTLSCNE